MKLKWLILAIGMFFYTTDGVAADAGFRFIKTNGLVRCGTDLSTDAYARKDADGIWRGIDADLCRVFSIAVFGSGDAFELVHVDTLAVDKAIAANKVDIMLGNAPFSASAEIAGKGKAVEVIYYDRQMLLARNAKNAKSMKDFSGKNTCTVAGSEDLYNLELFMDKYDLSMNLLKFPNYKRAKEAFLLNRCDILVGNETTLKAMQMNIAKKEISIPPEVIAYKPIYAIVHKDNVTLQVAVKWIMNAIILAEDYGINSKNVDIFVASKNKSVRNLLGLDKELWRSFGLEPEWVKIAVKELGNYGDIFNRNLGEQSFLQLSRDKNKLIKDDGLISSEIFL